jgi:uroporphyrinogen decarboxylase
MKPLERVALALQHKTPDRVPVYPLLNGISRHLVGANYRQWATDADTCAEAYIKITESEKLDIICTLTDLSVEAGDLGQDLNYPENEAAHPNHLNQMLKSIDDYKKVKWVNPRIAPRMSTHIRLCDKLVKAKGNDVPIVAFVFGPLGITSMLRGQADLYMDLLDDPDAVKNATQVVTSMLKDYCDALIETGVHAIMLDTLFASQSIMSKQMWLEFEGYLVKDLADHIHKQGCMVMVHNCGTGIYFDAQIAMMQPEAISFLHVPDDCTSLADAKAKYGDKTTLIGCVSPTWLPSATPEEVDDECRKQIEIMAPGGGYILATGCEYPANLSLDHARLMIAAAHKYGKY